MDVVAMAHYSRGGIDGGVVLVFWDLFGWVGLPCWLCGDGLGAGSRESRRVGGGREKSVEKGAGLGCSQGRLGGGGGGIVGWGSHSGLAVWAGGWRVEPCRLG